LFLIGTASDAGQKASVQLEHLPSTNSQSPLSEYSNTAYGIAFKYPKEWQESKAEGKDAVVKFAGVTSDGLNGEVILNRFADGGSPESIIAFVNQYAGSLADFKIVQEKNVAIGINRKIPAKLEDVTFSLGAMKVEQRYAVFQHNGETFSLAFTAPSAHFNSLTPVFNGILLSLRTGSGIAVGTKNVSTKPQAISTEKTVSLTKYRSDNLPLSFDYPADWKVTPGSHSDEAVSMQGLNPKGQVASIVLNKGELQSILPIDELADSLEKEYFETQKSFHRVSRQNQNFGRMSKINGVVQEQTFQKDGMLVKQMVAMFFHGDKAYALSLVAPGWKESDMRQLFSRILATVDLHER
jgi:hypothetical protein